MITETSQADLWSLSVRIFLVISIVLPVVVVFRRLFSPLSRAPGPFITRLTSLPLIYQDWKSNRTRWTISLHNTYGPVVRLSPTEVSFSSRAAVRDIYTGSTLKKTGSAVTGGTFGKGPIAEVFRHFGARNVVSAIETEDHGWRRKIVGTSYAQSAVISREAKTGDLWRVVGRYLEYVEREGKRSREGVIAIDIHSANLYFAGDAASLFMFGEGDSALRGNEKSRSIMEDAVEREEQVVHYYKLEYPSLIWFLELATSYVLRLRKSLSRGKESFSHQWVGGTKFRDWVFKSYLSVKRKVEAGEFGYGEMPTAAKFAANVIAGARVKGSEEPIGEDKGVRKYRSAAAEAGSKTKIRKFLRDEGAASESCDQMIAGIDTTSDQITYISYVLALRSSWQDKLRDELVTLGLLHPFSAPLSQEKIIKILSAPVLDAVVKETLRLYPAVTIPLHRVVPYGGRVIDGYFVPAGTIVGSTAVEIGSDEDVFSVNGKYDVAEWMPERWLYGASDRAEMNRRVWAFGSGGRGCIGKHLALLWIKLLLAGSFSRYKTVVDERTKVDIRNRQWNQRKTLRDITYFPKATGVIAFVPSS